MKTMYKVTTTDEKTAIVARQIEKETECYVSWGEWRRELKEHHDIWTRTSHKYFDDKKDAVRYAVAQAEKKITLHNAHIDSQRDSIAKILTEATKC